MRLVERHIVRDNRFEDICFKSGLLYNYVLYSVRQGIFSGNYLKEYEFSTKLGRENQFDFRNLPTDLSQQVVGQVFKSIRSWVKLKKDFDKNPSKYGDKISYKCKLVGISFQINEESYTSKVDHLAFEKLGKHDVYLGKRKKRGLFQSSIGKLLNADINGAIGIGRKVFGDFYVSKIIDSGFAFNPVRVSIL